MVQLQPPDARTAPACPRLGPGPLGLVLLTVLLGPAGQALGAPAEAGPVAMTPRELAVLWAADSVAIGSPLGTVALLNAGVGMALWRDWDSDTDGEDRAKKLASPLLRIVKDLTPYPDPKESQEEAAIRETALVTAADTALTAFANAARANRDELSLADLLRSSSAHRGQVVHVEGLLQSLERREPSEAIKDQGVDNIYEGLVQLDALGTTPALFLCTELPDNLRPGKDLKVRVALDGFFFKKIVLRTPRSVQVAPVVIGRMLQLLTGPAPPPDTSKAPLIGALVSGARDQTSLPSSEGPPQEYWGYYETLYVASRTFVPAFVASAQPNWFVTWSHLHNDPDAYRGKVIPIQGKLARLTLIPAPPELQALGVKQIYEAWVFGSANSGNPWLILITELPKGVKPGHTLDIDVSFAGYFFKKVLYPATPNNRYTSLLIGRTLQLEGLGPALVPPVVDEKKKADEFKDKAPPLKPLLGQCWEDIEDKTRIGGTGRKGNAGEFMAYCETVLVTARTTVSAFAASARENRGVSYYQLQKDPAAFRGNVIHVNGTVKRIRLQEAPEYLKVRGIERIYEAFILSRDSRDNPWWVIFLDLPKGLEVGENVDYPVSFDGYFFKKFRYTAAKEDRYAPLLIGRALQLKRVADTGWFTDRFVIGITGLILGMITLAVGLGWWFRRGDRKVRARVEGTRPEPTFEPADGPPAEEAVPYLPVHDSPAAEAKSPEEERFRLNGH